MTAVAVAADATVALDRNFFAFGSVDVGSLCLSARDLNKLLNILARNLPRLVESSVTEAAFELPLSLPMAAAQSED